MPFHNLLRWGGLIRSQFQQTNKTVYNHLGQQTRHQSRQSSSTFHSQQTRRLFPRVIFRLHEHRARLSLVGGGVLGYTLYKAFGDDEEVALAHDDSAHRASLLHDLIGANEESVVMNGEGNTGVAKYEINQYQANFPQCEDTYAVRERLSGVVGSLFGVFDGHSGKAASLFCKNRLFDFIEDFWREKGNPAQTLAEEPFLRADRTFLREAWTEQRFGDGLAGACLVVSHVTPQRVTTAHAGDCRAIVGRKVTNMFGKSYWQAIELTNDHQIDTNELERQRLLLAHPNEPDIIKSDRVKGRLQPTRGLGDGAYKSTQFFSYLVTQRPDLQKRYALTGWNPPYTTARPDISYHDITKNDVFLVLASDGLFSHMSSQEVVNEMGTYIDAQQDSAVALSLPEHSLTKNASTYLTEKALLRSSRRLKEVQQSKGYLSWIDMLDAVVKIPANLKRKYHDDITVLTVFLKHGTHSYSRVAN